MIWFLGIAGISLVLLGLWEGPGLARKRREAEALARKQPTVSEAWDILARPMQEEVIRIPQGRTGFGGDRRFVRGVLTGLGAGFMVASVVLSFTPRQAPPQATQTAEKTPAPVVTQPSPQPSGEAPAPTQPATPAPAVQPVNVNIAVEPGDPAETIAEKLLAQGLIKDTAAFLNRLAERGLETSLQAGTFPIPTNATLDQVIDHLTGQAG